MKVLVFGSDGFIGRNVCLELEKDHEVIRVVHKSIGNTNEIEADLLAPDSVGIVLRKIRPQVIVNCAGVVGASMDVNNNVQFTKNILDQASIVNGIKKIIISGSAGEYGRVDPENIPVNEGTPLNADSGYGLSKLQEEQLALKYNNRNGLNVIVLRIFNPIGNGMASRFLLTNLIQQVNELKLGKREVIELFRLDSKRDYITVEDIASAFSVVINNSPKERVYNVGSGYGTTNGELLDLVLKYSGIKSKPKIKEMSDNPEPLVAIQADISRIVNEFNWHPSHSIEDLIREICLL